MEVAIIVGLVWAVAQFAISEGCYRLAMWLDESGSGAPTEFLYDISDMAAWPAGILYDTEERRLVIEALRTSGKQTGTLENGDEVSIDQLTTSIEEEPYGEFDHLYSGYEVLDGMDLYPEVPIATEYTYYGGCCVAWGALVGLITYMLLAFNRNDGSSGRRSLESYR